MSIYMRGLLAFNDLERLADERDWTALYAYMEPDVVAWLWFKLREMPDLPEYFVTGKWALIQQIESMLVNAAREDVTLKEEKR